MGFDSLLLTRFGPATVPTGLRRTDAANEAGMSRRYGALLARAGLAGHRLGGPVTDNVWFKSRALFIGKAQKEPRP